MRVSCGNSAVKYAASGGVNVMIATAGVGVAGVLIMSVEGIAITGICVRVLLDSAGAIRASVCVVCISTLGVNNVTV